jgi:preprotein translocase subunit SecY
VLLSLVQSFTIAVYLERLTLANQFRIVDHPGWGFRLMTVLTLTTGTAFIMWLGEQITERGVGNGMSLIIFAGIVVGFPRAVLGTFNMIERGELSLLATVLLMALMTVVVAAIVFVERGQRRIPVQYAKRMVGRRMYGGQTTHLPLRVNTAGVIPVIFASSIIAFPQTVASWLGGNNPVDAVALRAAAVGDAALQPALRLVHPVLLLLLHRDRLQPRRRGRQHAQVRRLHPGIRPGKRTSEYLDHILGRITFGGASTSRSSRSCRSS